MMMRLACRLLGRQKAKPTVVTLSCGETGKTALVSYIKDVFIYDDAAPQLNDHTSKWESKEIARIFQRLGYEVDLIDYNDAAFIPQKPYDVIFDIHYNIDRYAPFLPQSCIKILHITGSYPGYSIAQELKRVEALELRKNVHYSPKRIVDNVYFTRSMQKADFCTLFGNEFTISTFPEELQHKLHLVTPTASQVLYQKEADDFVPNKKAFLWMYGSGAVHKGLDLLLDIFSKRTDIELHIVGSVDREKDFCAIYEKELFHTPNIHFHGFLNGLSKEFSAVTEKCFAFIAPSCSESLSVAAATCLKIGLFPILSIQNGINLPDGCGITLSETNNFTLNEAIDKAMSMPTEVIMAQIEICQNQAIDLYSRASFTDKMETAIKKAVHS